LVGVEIFSTPGIFRVLTKSGLLVKCKKIDLICKANKTYEVTSRVSNFQLELIVDSSLDDGIRVGEIKDISNIEPIVT
jgi:hypothetical protein